MAKSIAVTLVSAWPDRVERQTLSLPAGARVADALAVADGLPENPDIGLWGKRVPLDTLLADGDRVELYRPLLADPKAARKKRATEQGYRWQGRTRRAAKQIRA